LAGRPAGHFDKISNPFGRDVRADNAKFVAHAEIFGADRIGHIEGTALAVEQAAGGLRVTDDPIGTLQYIADDLRGGHINAVAQFVIQ